MYVALVWMDLFQLIHCHKIFVCLFVRTYDNFYKFFLAYFPKFLNITHKTTFNIYKKNKIPLRLTLDLEVCSCEGFMFNSLRCQFHWIDLPS